MGITLGLIIDRYLFLILRTTQHEFPYRFSYFLEPWLYTIPDYLFFGENHDHISLRTILKTTGYQVSFLITAQHYKKSKTCSNKFAVVLL